MSDHDRTWDEDSVSLPPTPGRNLNIQTSTTNIKETISSKSSKAKRRLDLEDPTASHSKKTSNDHRPVIPVDVLKKQKLKPFTIPKKTKPSKAAAEQEVSKLKQKPKETEEVHIQKKIKTEPDHHQTKIIRPPTEELQHHHQQLPTAKRIKTEEDNHQKKLYPTEERALDKRLKTQAWARILKSKQKLYIPHTSDPRTEEEEAVHDQEATEDVTPIMMDKENCHLVVNVTATLMTTPVKMSDHNSIIKFMSITPLLLSPLAENPRMVK